MTSHLVVRWSSPLPPPVGGSYESLDQENRKWSPISASAIRSHRGPVLWNPDDQQVKDILKKKEA